jgi:hypothetical protein
VEGLRGRASFEHLLEIIPPRYAPEWGSGGIFGLTYCSGVLYYMLAFEAEANFVWDGGRRVYRFEELGPGPVSGGDTYNAVACADERIFFGGWVHNPVVYKGKRGFEGEIDFRNKFSHVHVYYVREDKVKLLWSESIRDESRWAGEVSEIVYDPLNSRLIIARGDGHENLGVFTLDPSTGRVERASSIPALKGALFLDYACFDMQSDWVRGIDGVQCMDLVSGRWYRFSVEDWSRISVDGGSVSFRGSGYAVSAYTRYFHFFRGGFIAGNPVEPEVDSLSYVRLFDFGSHVYSQPSPQRSNALTIGGGILAPFNALTHGLLHSDIPRDTVRSINEVRGPSVLLYITPPQARIVGAYGARITSMAKMGSKVVIAYNTAPNLGGRDASPIDVGYRGLVAVDEDTLINRPSPPVTFRIRGSDVGTSTFGGIPLAGYKSRKLVVRTERSNTLTVYEYDVGLPASLLSVDKYTVSPGRNVIDMEGYHNIVSMKFSEPSPDALIYVNLM